MCIMTIDVSGFPVEPTLRGIREFVDRYSGKLTLCIPSYQFPRVMERTSMARVSFRFATSERHYDDNFLKIMWKIGDQGPYMKFYVCKAEYIPRENTSLSIMEDTVLHFGYPVSENKISLLWTVVNVEVHFRFNLQKISIFLSYGIVPYKLEITFQSILKIQHYRSTEQRAEFLLIRVQAPPLIYEWLHEDPLAVIFNQWFRVTDFSPSCSIGQSSVLVLQLPNNCSLPNIKEYFSNYEEVPDNLDLNEGYSRSLDLVSNVTANYCIDVPHTIHFKINQMAQTGILIGPTLDADFFKLVSPQLWPISYIKNALEKMAHLKISCFNPSNWLQEQYKQFQISDHQPKSSAISLDAGLVYVHRVYVTPSKVYFHGPEVNVSNAVLRKYSEDLDNFILVSFVDEDYQKMYSTDFLPHFLSEKRRTGIYRRILSTLRTGIYVGKKNFEFLAFSSSDLSEKSAWMFSSRSGLTADDIRKWMGDFQMIKNVAEYASCLGQPFSVSTETLTVASDEVEIARDIENATGYVISDGIGKISVEFARSVATKCGLKSITPSAFHVTYGGYRGIVSVDPTSSKKLTLRKSMFKYESDDVKLHVLAYSASQPCFLNRQLIILLSTLGVDDHIFERKQEENIVQLDNILIDSARAEEVIEIMPSGEVTNVIKEMLLCGFKPGAEPFLSMLLQAFRATKMLDLRTESRIFVPKGRAMMGCLDETGTLECGQIFVQVSYTRSTQLQADCQTVVIKGNTIVSKNPALHPGDLGTLVAIDVPDLHHMIDCVVFSQKGKIYHPNEHSGCYLDGDMYFVSWDPDLIPPHQVKPVEYSPAPTVTVDHDIAIEEVQECFATFIINDRLKVIADSHTVIADKSWSKAKSRPCIELAKLYSDTVDFPKTGKPVEIPPDLRACDYPDFMEKPNEETYESRKVIGKLFRAVKDHNIQPGHSMAFTKEMVVGSYDPDMEVCGFKEYINEAFLLKGVYDYKLGHLMDLYGMKTEAEIFSGSIMRMSNASTKYRGGEAIELALRSLRREARSWFSEKSGHSSNIEENEYAKASAWYHVTYHPDYWNRYNEEGFKWPHFLSFPWCVSDRLIQIKQMCSLQRGINRRLITS